MARTIIFVLLLCTGCASSYQNSTKAVLFKAQPKQQSDYSLPKNAGQFPLASNPVYVSDESKFSIRINAIHPSWIRPTESPNSVDFQSLSGEISPNYFEHIRGKQLWLLTTIQSLDTSDPLETNSKKYFKATNVKLDSQSHALVPLDSSERYVFTHESDSSYRIQFQLYEVNDLALKSELVRASRNPGVVGVLDDILETSKNLLGAVAGEVVEERFSQFKEEDLAIERLLLQAGASEEFNGTLIVVRDDDFRTKYGDNVIDLTDTDIQALGDTDPTIKNLLTSDSVPIQYVENQYLLVDTFKCLSQYRNYDFSDPSKYDIAASTLESMQYHFDSSDTDLVIVNGESRTPKQQNMSTGCESLRANSFIQFSVGESHSPRLAQVGDTSADNGGLNVSETENLYEKVEDALKTLDSKSTDLQRELSELSRNRDERKAEISEIENYKDEIERAIREADVDKSFAEQKILDLRASLNADDPDENHNAKARIQNELSFYSEQLPAINEFISNRKETLSEQEAKLFALRQDLQELDLERETKRNEIQSRGLSEPLEKLRDQLNRIPIERWRTHVSRIPD